uniref:Secreted protein n=1 Tax=Fagus sylvatica TaxID=28930 RepID=A0A2N9J088_FAGSY
MREPLLASLFLTVFARFSLSFTRLWNQGLPIDHKPEDRNLAAPVLGLPRRRRRRRRGAPTLEDPGHREVQFRGDFSREGGRGAVLPRGSEAIETREASQDSDRDASFSGFAPPFVDRVTSSVRPLGGGSFCCGFSGAVGCRLMWWPIVVG